MRMRLEPVEVVGLAAHRRFKLAGSMADRPIAAARERRNAMVDPDAWPA